MRRRLARAWVRRDEVMNARPAETVSAMDPVMGAAEASGDPTLGEDDSAGDGPSARSDEPTAGGDEPHGRRR